MKIFVRLMKLVAPAWLVMLGAAILALITVSANVGLLTTAAFLISAAALHPPLAVLSPAIVGVRFFGVSRAVSRYFERYVAHDVTFRLLSRIRVWCYRALEPLVPAGLAGLSNAGLFSRVVHEVEVLQYFYLQVMLPPAVATMALLVLALLLAHFALAFSVLLAAGFLLVGAALPAFLQRLGGNCDENLPIAQARLVMTLAGGIRGMRDLVAFGQVDNQLRQISDAAAEYAGWQKRSANLSGLADVGGNLVMNLTMIGAVIIAVPLITAGRLDGVYLAVLALGIQSSFEAVLPLTAGYRHWQEVRTAAERLFALLDAKPVVNVAGYTAGLPASYDLAVENVTFRYPNSPAVVIDDLSFYLPAGERLAIVGPSGSGKSTLLSLLVRFWDYDAGHIRLGGKDIGRYQPRVLCDAVGAVLQNDYVFNASLGDNIQLARPWASPDEILAAANQAALGELIRSLPLGLETMVGENGHGLSGGQRRQISIARAVLKNPPLLILDEPTAGLDPVTEHKIMNLIEGLMVGRTTIIITHRLTGLENMDEILVLNQGKVVERGSQAELLAQNGWFYAMRCLQNDILM